MRYEITARDADGSAGETILGKPSGPVFGVDGQALEGEWRQLAD